MKVSCICISILSLQSFVLNSCYIFFRTKKHRRQKYAKFLHEGTHESCFKFYSKIYAFWLLDVGLELVDLPTLEFYPNYYEHAPSQNILTEIYIPVK